MGDGGIDPPFLVSAIHKESGQLNAFAALSPVRGLGGPQGRFGCCGEEKNRTLTEKEPGPLRP
jgi:hypothetical protein